MVQWLATWTTGPVGWVTRGGLTLGLGTKKYLWDTLMSPTHTRRSEVGGAEPEIWRSPNQKRNTT